MADQMRFEDRMSDADALMWTIEKDPLLRSTITTVVVLDRSPDPDRLRGAVERCSRLVPRLRQRVVSNMLSVAPPRWETDAHFDLDFHLRRLRAPGDGTLRDVLDIAEPIAMQGFDRARPLWEFHSVDGLADGKAALILKLHHAITDGVGGVKIAMHLFDTERDGDDRGPMPDAPPVHVLGQSARLVDAMQHERRRQLGILRRTGAAVAGAAVSTVTDAAGTVRRFGETAGSVARMLRPATKPMSPLLTGRSLSVHFDTIVLPLDELKAAARKAEGKLNDAFVAAVAGGLRRYHEHHGVIVDSLRMTMPINVRTHDTENLAGNMFAPARFPVPVDISNPVERMWTIHEIVAQQRSEPALQLTEPLAGILYRLPATVATAVFGAMLKGVDFVTSNVPGIPIPVFLAGARMEAQFPFGPMSGSATNITLLSYLDELQIGVNSDPAAIPDPDVFTACLVDAFDEIRKA